MVSFPDSKPETSGIEAYFLALQEQLNASLGFAGVISHPGARGDESEADWEAMLKDYLPSRYQVVSKCFVVDHNGETSQEIDIALCDRQYSTMVFSAQARLFVPAEAVYAVFEVKPRIKREYLRYAAEKAASVRRLERTSAPIVDARGRIDEPKPPPHILGGLLATGSDWANGIGSSFVEAVRDEEHSGRLDLGCVLNHGGWDVRYEGAMDADPIVCVSVDKHALVAFYLRLLQRLQEIGTVPAMDLGTWSAFLRDREPPPAPGP